MPDPLCRLHGISVVIGREEDRDDRAQRLVAPHEARLLRLALGLTVRQLRGIAASPGAARPGRRAAPQLHRRDRARRDQPDAARSLQGRPRPPRAGVRICS